MTIYIGKEERPLNLHRAIVCRNSYTLREYCTWQDDELYRYVIDEYPSTTVETVIRYLYTGIYDVNAAKNMSEIIQTFACAAWLGVPSLLKVILDGLSRDKIREYKPTREDEIALGLGLYHTMLAGESKEMAYDTMCLKRMLVLICKLGLQKLVLNDEHDLGVVGLMDEIPERKYQIISILMDYCAELESK